MEVLHKDHFLRTKIFWMHSLPNFLTHGALLHARALLLFSRDVTKISSCQVITTSRCGIKQLRISFGSIFLLIDLCCGHFASGDLKSFVYA